MRTEIFPAEPGFTCDECSAPAVTKHRIYENTRHGPIDSGRRAYACGSHLEKVAKLASAGLGEKSPVEGKR